MAKVKDIDYLTISSRVRALESSLLTGERMTRMLESPTTEDAVKILSECGYPELTPLNVNTLHEALTAEHRRIFEDLYAAVPEPAFIDIFKIKYDYHNVKVLLKSEATGTDGTSLLSELGRVPSRELAEKMNASDLRGIPPILQEAINSARDILGTTRDPQLADFALDRAYYQDMWKLAQRAESPFLEGYVKISIDAANLRTAVRAIRMGKNAEFLRDILFTGGNMDVTRILTSASAGGSLAELFALSPLKEAAEAGVLALAGGRLTQFEKLCDNAVTKYLQGAKYVAFGEAPVIAYLASKENEFTAIRIILTGRMAGLDAPTIQERLRDSYV